MKKKKTRTHFDIATFEVLQDATGKPTKAPTKKKAETNPAAVALGRLGGFKEGKARATKLSLEARSKIARRAANERWKSW